MSRRNGKDSRYLSSRHPYSEYFLVCHIARSVSDNLSLPSRSAHLMHTRLNEVGERTPTMLVAGTLTHVTHHGQLKISSTAREQGHAHTAQTCHHQSFRDSVICLIHRRAEFFFFLTDSLLEV